MPAKPEKALGFTQTHQRRRLWNPLGISSPDPIYAHEMGIVVKFERDKAPSWVFRAKP